VTLEDWARNGWLNRITPRHRRSGLAAASRDLEAARQTPAAEWRFAIAYLEFVTGGGEAVALLHLTDRDVRPISGNDLLQSPRLE
jgi:hypothetical protein